MDVVNLLTHAAPATAAKGKPASGAEPGAGFDDALSAARGSPAAAKSATPRASAQAAADAPDANPDPRQALLDRLDAADLLGAARAGARPDPDAADTREDPRHDADADPAQAPLSPFAPAALPAMAGSPDAATDAAGSGHAAAVDLPPGGPRAPRTATMHPRIDVDTDASQAKIPAGAAATEPARPTTSDRPAAAPGATAARGLRHAIPQQAQAGSATQAAAQDAGAPRASAPANTAALVAPASEASHAATGAPVDGSNATLTGLFGPGPTAHAGATAPAGAAATTAAPTLQAPIGTPPWQQELGLQLVALTQRGGSHVELHLNPRDLGPLQISLTLDHQSAQAQFFAAHAVVRDAVQQAIPELRAALAGQGIALGEAMVGQQQQQQAGTGNFAHPAPWTSSAGTEREIEGVQRVAAARIPLRVAPGAGVDLYA